jgi:hypothetical protein
MKNVYLLATDKPSKLFIDIDDNKLKITIPIGGEHMMNQHIYITNDEEIKIDDWCIDKHNFVYKQETDKIFSEFTGSKKIILTTDIDLIKDGVQAIDDEFLEWFVKNPSCEFVEVKKFRSFKEIYSHYEYMIIIPKEEPKQENCCTPAGQIKRYVDCKGCDRKPKQMSKPTALDLY